MKTQPKTITVHDLKTKMDKDPNCCLIDVRELDEWQAMRIPNAHHIPKDQICERIGEVTTDKTQTIHLHCRGGVRSLYAAQRLIDAGYENVYSVDGGIVDWAMFGYPVEE